MCGASLRPRAFAEKHRAEVCVRLCRRSLPGCFGRADRARHERLGGGATAWQQPLSWGAGRRFHVRRVRWHTRSVASTWCASTPSRPSTRRLTSATFRPAAAPTLSAALSPSRSEAASACAVPTASGAPASAARRLRFGHVQRVLVQLRAAELQGCLERRVVCELEVREPLQQLAGWLALQGAESVRRKHWR